MPLTIDMTQALAGLQIIARMNIEPFLAEVGAKETAAIQKRITESKVSPEAEAWSPWRPMTSRLREAKGNAAQGLLWDTGALLNSMRFDVSLFEVAIGTDIRYAQELQEGRAGPQPMAARPFVGWSPADIAGVEFSAIAYIDGFMK